MTGIRQFLEAQRPAIVTVALITAVQGFVAMLVTDGPAAPAIMLLGLVVMALALVPGARSSQV